MSRVRVVKTPEIPGEGASQIHKFLGIFQVIASILLITIGTQIFIPEMLFDIQSYQWILSSSPILKMYCIIVGIIGVIAAFLWIKMKKLINYAAPLIHGGGMLIVAEVGSIVGTVLCMLVMVLSLLIGWYRYPT